MFLLLILCASGSGKDITESKGVYREVEFEKSGCGKSADPRVNPWSDEQKSHIRLCMRVGLQYKLKPNNYAESYRVNVADGWREDDKEISKKWSDAKRCSCQERRRFTTGRKSLLVVGKCRSG